MPAFTAYFISRSFNLEPIAHKVCLNLPTKDNCALPGVWTVFGACGFTLGNQDACEKVFSGRKYVARDCVVTSFYFSKDNNHTYTEAA